MWHAGCSLGPAGASVAACRLSVTARAPLVACRLQSAWAQRLRCTVGGILVLWPGGELKSTVLGADHQGSPDEYGMSLFSVL